MLRQINRYCSTCLRTRKFVNLEDRLVCQFCGKRLWHVRHSHPAPEPVAVTPHEPARIRQLHLDAVV